MMLLDLRNVFVCAPMHLDRIKRIKDKPRWLTECHIQSDMRCHNDIGYHFDQNGKMHSISMHSFIQPEILPQYEREEA